MASKAAVEPSDRSGRTEEGVPPRSLVIQVVRRTSSEEARCAYLEADQRADVVEIRLDTIRDLNVDRLLGTRGKPKLVTVRSRQQGGGARPAERESLLRAAVAAQVEYLDLELGDESLPFLRVGQGPRRILSYHDLESTPIDLPALYARLRSAGQGALLKIVTFAEVASDNLRLRDLLRAADADSLIAFGMGPKGVPSRILAPFWGSAGAYAPRRGDAASAPGQVPLEDLFDLYRFDSIDSDTRLIGIVGHPLGHSLSPLVHNMALKALDLNYRYLPFEATTLAEFLPLMSELRLCGLSVTQPHKETILPYLDRLDPVARRTGAVNTVVKTWNRLEGFNTDAEAALVPLRGRIDLQGARVAIMGAGGAARALLDALTRAGARVTLFNRTATRARELARRFGVRHLPWRRLRRLPCDLLVNATSAGCAPNLEETPLPADWVAAPLVYDLVYNPAETRFLREARSRGAQVIGGGEMFLAQAVAQFRLFTGRDAPVEKMRQAVSGGLESPRLDPTPPQPGDPGAATPRSRRRPVRKPR